MSIRIVRAGHAFAVATLIAASAAAEVCKVEILSRTSVLDGRTWGASGAYEKLVGRIEFAVDPALEANSRVVDLALAPRGADGRVHASGDLMILRPVDPKLGSGTALLEVSNRGGKAALGYFNRARGSADPTTSDDFGDGFLMRRGLTIVWVGWEFDVPAGEGRLHLDAPVAHQDAATIDGLVRCDWVVDAATKSLELGHRGQIPYAPLALDESDARLTLRDGRLAARREVPRSSWHFSSDARSIESDAGFESGHIYELVYRAKDPVVVGLGLVAIRDTLAYAKYAADAAFHVERGVGLGISQTGRFLRHFVWQGFNSDEHGRQVFDGLLIQTAGAGRGSFNHRFAQPSRDAHRYSSFFYPTDIFPFSGRLERDPLTGASDGILARALGDQHAPKIFYTNTGYEYWGRAAALLHSALDGSVDLEPLANERIYHLIGGQHYVVPLPKSNERIGAARAWHGDPLDFLPTERALFSALLEWVEHGREPPPSEFPRIDRRELVAIGDVRFPAIDGLAFPTHAEEAYHVDFGQRWLLGIVDDEPPKIGIPFATLVPQVDANGNELGGVRALEIDAPLASYFPWSLRTGKASPDELEDFVGTFAPFPRTEAERSAAHDRRPSLEALYGTREKYLALARDRARELIQKRWLLDEDLERVVARAGATWDWIQAQDR